MNLEARRKSYPYLHAKTLFRVPVAAMLAGSQSPRFSDFTLAFRLQYSNKYNGDRHDGAAYEAKESLR